MAVWHLVFSCAKSQKHLACRYAEPRYEMEKEVEEGKLVGSMYGVVPNRDWKEPAKAADIKPMTVS